MKIGNWKLEIVILALLLFSWSEYTHAAVTGLTRPSNYLGIVGYWTFDGKDMPQGRANDISGNNNHGSLVGMSTTTHSDGKNASTTAYVAGKIGQGLRFDGVNDYLSIGNSATLQNLPDAGPFSVAFLVRNRSAGNGSSFIGKGTGSNVGWSISVNGGNRNVAMTMQRATTDMNFASPVNSLPTIFSNTWVHATVVYAGGDTASASSIYINGSVTTPTSLANGDGAYQTDTTSDLRIARNSFSGFQNASVDDVRIYNRVLSAGEILQLYNQGQAKIAKTQSPAPCGSGAPLSCGLVGHWTFDGKDTPGRANDISGQGNHGNLVAMSTSTSRVPGKIGQGLKFDGVNDYVKISSDIIGTTALTITAWIKPTASTLSVGTGRIVTNGNVTIFKLASSNRLSFTSNSSNVAVSATNALSGTANTWQFISVTRNESGTANIYLNGTLTGTANQNSGSPIVGTDFEIGAQLAASFFDGSIDDVRVYNRALSPTEVQRLYQLGR